jgi:alkaline phosphatase
MDTTQVMMWFAAAVLAVEVTAFLVWRLMRRPG